MPEDAVPAVVCQQVVELLSDYLEGALPTDLAARVRAHLDLCGPCREFLDQVRTTIALVGAVPDAATLPPELAERLVLEFRSEFRREAPGADRG